MCLISTNCRHPRGQCSVGRLAAEATLNDSPTPPALNLFVEQAKADTEWEPEYRSEDTYTNGLEY